MRRKRVVSILIVFVLMINMLVITASAENEIKLIIDGQERSLSWEIYLSGDDTVYVPLIETFTYLGINITKNYDNTYIGAGANGEIVITVGKDTAEVDWVDIELPAPVIEKDGTVMVPAYLIEDAAKTQMPVYDAQNRTLSIISPDNTGTGEDSFDIGKVIETLPEGERIITQDDLYGSNAYGEAGWEYLEVKKGVSINHDGYTDALQLKTREMPYGEVPAVSNIAYRVNLTGKQDMKKGDVAVIHFKARATEVTDESGKANLVVLYE